MVSNLKLTNADENWAIFEVDNNGRDVADVAKEWLKKMNPAGSHGLIFNVTFIALNYAESGNCRSHCLK